MYPASSTHKGVNVTCQGWSSSSASLNRGNDLAGSHEQSPSTLYSSEETPLLLLHPQQRPVERDSPDGTIAAIMENVKKTRLAYWADKLAVESEPGLTNAQVSQYLNL